VRTGFLKKTARAFTLVEVLVVVVVMAVLAAIFLPLLPRQKSSVSRLSCVNHLKQVGLAFRQWSIDNDDKFPMQVSITKGGAMEFVPTGLVFPHFQVMSNELMSPKVLLCPADKERTNAKNFTSDLNDWKTSYFIGVDADIRKPAALLAGDRNLTVGGVPTRRGLVTLGTNSTVGWTSQIHTDMGNVLLGDNSVAGVSKRELRQLLQQTGMATNRLAIP
jgi:prepilin-type N-terminal cleavage/methylation domain-containing protein